jgi:outer membrane protein assembly factor BamB
VGFYWTTRCCSAFALITALASSAIAQQTMTVAAGGQQTTSVVAGQQTTVAGDSPARANRRGEGRNMPPTFFPASEVWDLPLATLQATPAFKNDRGYVPLGDAQFAAYDVRHGTLLWVAPAQTKFEPTIGDGLIFVIEPDAIVALREESGIEAWRFALDSPLSAPLTCHNGWLVATTTSGGVLALRAGDGELLWRQELDATIHTSATLVDDRIYVPMTDGRVVALQVETGEPVWEHRLGGAPNEIQATSDLVYAGATDNYLYALRARDGTIAWRWPTGGNVIGRPVVDKRLVYFVSFDNVLRALDKNTGNQRWKRGLAFRPTRGLVVMGETVIASGMSRSATAFSIKDGAPAGSMAGSGDELAAPPHVITGEGLPMVVLLTRDLSEGAVLRAVARDFNPRVFPIAPLPNPVAPPAAPEGLATEEAQPADTDRATEDAVMP